MNQLIGGNWEPGTMNIAIKPWKYKLLFPIYFSAELYGSIMRKGLKCKWNEWK